jgi:hypothetical protein
VAILLLIMAFIIVRVGKISTDEDKFMRILTFIKYLQEPIRLSQCRRVRKEP